MRRCDSVVARQIHDSFFLIDTKQNYSDDTCSLYEINEIGFYIWNELNEDIDIDQITKKLYDQIVDEIPYEDLLSDVKEYLDILIEKQFVVI